jgi:hypothetical protein
MRALPKKLRFEVLKRDGFRCRYCGATPAQAMLHVDHVVPVAKGGTNDPMNLVVACQPCNSGKGAVSLDDPSKTTKQTAAALREHAEQIMEYLAAQQKHSHAVSAVLESLAREMEKIAGYPLAKNEFSGLRGHLRSFSAEDIVAAFSLAIERINPTTDYHRTKVWRYFCGILRNWRTEGVNL